MRVPFFAALRRFFLRPVELVTIELHEDDEDPECLSFHVAGVSRVVQVTIGLLGTQCSCRRPNSARMSCKHKRFVFNKVLGLNFVMEGRCNAAVVRQIVMERILITKPPKVPESVSQKYICAVESYSKLQELPPRNDECAICFDALAGTKIRVCPVCRHGAHLDCLRSFQESWESCAARRARCIHCNCDPRPEPLFRIRW